MTGVGFGASSINKCRLLYQSNTTKDQATYVASAATLTDSGPDWFNLVSSTDRDRLRQNLTLDEDGSATDLDLALKYIAVDWIRVIRLQAALVSQNDNDTAFTRAPTSYAPCLDWATNTTCNCSSTNVSSAFHTATSAALAAITRDETLTAYPMQQPFWVGNGAYTIALAFNVKKFFKMTQSDECGAFTDSAGYQLRVPFPHFAPVWYDTVANSSSVVKKETYSITGHTVANVTYRLELYYVSTDDLYKVHSADFVDTFTSTTAGVPRRVHQLMANTDTNTTHTTFYNYAGTPVFLNLARRSDSSTVMQCTWCSTVANATLTVTYNGASTVVN